jgi:hypothetical protein
MTRQGRMSNGYNRAMSSPASSRASRRRVAFAVLLAAVMPVMISAQAAPAKAGRLSGTVADTQGKGLAGATVTLSSDTSDLKRTATTDKKGAYRFDDVPTGQYQVSAQLTAFVTTTRAAVVTDDKLDVALRFFLGRSGGEIVRAPGRERAPRPVLTVPFGD